MSEPPTLPNVGGPWPHIAKVFGSKFRATSRATSHGESTPMVRPGTTVAASRASMMGGPPAPKLA
jgi:hypothetical protein